MKKAKTKSPNKFKLSKSTSIKDLVKIKQLRLLLLLLILLAMPIIVYFSVKGVKFISTLAYGIRNYEKQSETVELKTDDLKVSDVRSVEILSPKDGESVVHNRGMQVLFKVRINVPTTSTSLVGVDSKGAAFVQKCSGYWSLKCIYNDVPVEVNTSLNLNSYYNPKVVTLKVVGTDGSTYGHTIKINVTKPTVKGIMAQSGNVFVKTVDLMKLLFYELVYYMKMFFYECLVLLSIIE